MSEIPNLLYLDGWHVISVPYTRDRAMSVSPIFYTTERDALLAAKTVALGAAEAAGKRLWNIETELAKG